MAALRRSLESLAAWTPTAFLVAGLALGVGVALAGLPQLTPLSPPGWLPALASLVGLLGAFVGLLGFYPAVADRIPGLATWGVTIAGGGAILLIVALCWAVVVDLTGGPSLAESPGPVPLFVVGSILALGCSLLCYGVAVSRTGILPSGVGTLLLVPGGVLLADILYVVASSALGVPVVPAVPILPFLVAALAIAELGRRLRAAATAPEHGGRTDTPA